MEFKQVVAKRHSVRDFTDRPVSRQDLVDIVRTAQRAPLKYFFSPLFSIKVFAIKLSADVASTIFLSLLCKY